MTSMAQLYLEINQFAHEATISCLSRLSKSGTLSIADAIFVHGLIVAFVAFAELKRGRIGRDDVGLMINMHAARFTNSQYSSVSETEETKFLALNETVHCAFLEIYNLTRAYFDRYLDRNFTSQDFMRELLLAGPSIYSVALKKDVTVLDKRLLIISVAAELVALRESLEA